MIISITGFMGCGKSSVGRELSELLCCPFIDLDEMIERQTGKKIPEIFGETGERGFRKIEKEVLKSAVIQREGKEDGLKVISLGGGTIMTSECEQLIRSHTRCIYLRASVRTLLDHLEGETSHRPMLSGNIQDRITELMSLRTDTYERTAHITIDIDGKTVEGIAKEIISALKTDPAVPFQQ